MLNERLANIALFCGDDIDNILECTAAQISDYMEGHELEFLTANQIGRIFLDYVEFYISDAVKTMRRLRS